MSKENVVRPKDVTRKAQEACATWLAGCLRLGWAKEQLDALETIWWQYHDRNGQMILSNKWFAEFREGKYSNEWARIGKSRKTIELAKKDAKKFRETTRYCDGTAQYRIVRDDARNTIEEISLPTYEWQMKWISSIDVGKEDSSGL